MRTGAGFMSLVQLRSKILGRVFPLSLFIGSLLVAFWYPLIADRLWWGAFATPFLIHLLRNQPWVKPVKEKAAFDQPDATGKSL
jgi:hypothetical protein